MGAVNVLKSTEQIRPLGVRHVRQFAQHTCRRDGVFVANLIANHVAIAFLTTGDESSFAFLPANGVRNPLESRQGLVHIETGVASDVRHQIRSDNGFGNEIARREQVLLDALGNHVVHEQRSGLVAVQEPPPAFGLRIGHGDAHPVRIGIGA